MNAHATIQTAKPAERAVKPFTSGAVIFDTRTEEGRSAVLDVMAGLAEGARFAPSLEQSVSAAAKVCGPDFAEALARRYGNRVAAAVAALPVEG